MMRRCLKCLCMYTAWSDISCIKKRKKKERKLWWRDSMQITSTHSTQLLSYFFSFFFSVFWGYTFITTFGSPCNEKYFTLDLLKDKTPNRRYSAKGTVHNWIKINNFSVLAFRHSKRVCVNISLVIQNCPVIVFHRIGSCSQKDTQVCTSNVLRKVATNLVGSFAS